MVLRTAFLQAFVLCKRCIKWLCLWSVYLWLQRFFSHDCCNEWGKDIRLFSPIATYYMIPTTWHSGKGDVSGTIKQLRALRLSNREGETNKDRGHFYHLELFFILLQWWTHDIIHVFKNIELYITVNYNVNHEFGS